LGPFLQRVNVNFLHSIFSSDGFMPHGMCYMWQPGVIWLHVVSDALIALAYYSIPITLVYFVRRRRELEFSWIYLCFAVFIVACGTTHLMEILNIWHPVYWLSGIIKAITAIVSVVTAILLVRLVPKAVVIPSPQQLREANDDLRNKTRLLEAANQELEAFSYSVSHDLRAPLRNIQGFSEILQQESGAALDDSAKLYLGRIIHSAQRMGMLIDDLLAFSKMSASQLTRSPVDMSGLAEEVARELGEVEAKNRAIEWKIAPLPPVVGDSRLLKQVWLNLLGNAVKFTRNRVPARIEVGASERDDAFEFHVRDNGVGFAMETAGRLFGIFERLDQDFEGTGVGLANVRRIVERHGGTTRAEAVLGQGATFYFTLPKEKRK
jgi:signal transduction histidine kinase